MGATGVSILTKPKSAPWKTSAHVGEEGGPALDIRAVGGCGSANGLVRDHVPGDGEADASQFVGIGDDGLGSPNGMMKDGSGQDGDQRERQESAKGETGAWRFPAPSHGLARVMHRFEHSVDLAEPDQDTWHLTGDERLAAVLRLSGKRDW